MTVNIQRISRASTVPANDILLHYAETALSPHQRIHADITLRIVNKKESAYFNQTYRHKSEPTNVLSFAYTQVPILSGDIILCATLIQSWAEWAHLIIHGILHLKGYDHETPWKASIMENLEIKLLKTLGIPSPYIA